LEDGLEDQDNFQNYRKQQQKLNYKYINYIDQLKTRNLNNSLFYQKIINYENNFRKYWENIDKHIPDLTTNDQINLDVDVFPEEEAYDDDDEDPDFDEITSDDYTPEELSEKEIEDPDEDEEEDDILEEPSRMYTENDDYAMYIEDDDQNEEFKPSILFSKDEILEEDRIFNNLIFKSYFKKKFINFIRKHKINEFKISDIRKNFITLQNFNRKKKILFFIKK